MRDLKIYVNQPVSWHHSLKKIRGSPNNPSLFKPLVNRFLQGQRTQILGKQVWKWTEGRNKESFLPVYRLVYERLDSFTLKSQDPVLMKLTF